MTLAYRVGSGALCAFYALVCYLALTPNVSDDYRAYYISRTSQISPSQKRTMRPVCPGETIDYRDSRVGFDGWFAPEVDSRRSSQNAAVVDFLWDSHACAGVSGILTIDAITIGRQTVLVYLNGKALYSGMIDSGPLPQLRFSPELLAAENELRFEFPDAQPITGDHRTYALAFRALTVK